MLCSVPVYIRDMSICKFWYLQLTPQGYKNDYRKVFEDSDMFYKHLTVWWWTSLVV